MPDLNGKTVLVTGATSGIGREAALALHEMGAHLVLVARSEQKAKELLDRLGQRAEVLLADLSSLAEVRRVATEVRQRHDRLDVLLNNAGAYFSHRETTSEGLERTLALNHLAYFVLTTELLDLLRASAPARVVNVASNAHRGARLRLDDLQLERWPAAGWGAYQQSKLANVMFTFALARRLAGTEVTTCAVHPGFVATGFAKSTGLLARVVMALTRPVQRSPRRGAETLIWAATAPTLAGRSGLYLADCRERRADPVAYDEAAQERLWEESEALVQRALG